MKTLLLLIMSVGIFAAEYKYKFTYAESPSDKAQVRVDIEKYFRDAGITVKSISIREGNGPKVNLNYVVVVEGEVVLKTINEAFNKDRSPKATITQVVDVK